MHLSLSYPSQIALVLVVLLCGSALRAHAAGDDRTIVKADTACGAILLRPDASERETQAAMEIQRCVLKSTGATLPAVSNPQETEGYVIRLTLRAAKPSKSAEAFEVSVRNSGAEIAGNSPLGVYYGTCAFLEKAVGVRWYLPGPLGEIIPRHDVLVLPRMRLKERPSFPMRWVGQDEWMLRNKQNRCEDGFWIFPSIYHTQHALLSPSEYFDSHPEFFALIDGKRSNNPNAKLCYGNPETAQQVAKNMAAMLDADPGIDLISLSPTDGQMWCECDACRNMDEEGVPKDMSKSRRSLLFYNAVAQELRKTHPETKMLVGAYNVYNWPPQDKTIKADPMLNVIITHYEDYCMAHPVADRTCPPNERYVELIHAWQKRGCDVYFYEYYWKVNWMDLPWPIVHCIREDIPWYKKQGCKGLYTQYNEDCIWSLFPVHYVAARLLWDTNTDVDAVLDDMYTDLFGEAAPAMKAYYECMEAQMAACPEHFPGHGVSMGPHVFTKDVRKELRQHLEEATAINTDSVVAQRLDKVGVSLEYVDRLMDYAAMKQKADSDQDAAASLTKAEEALALGEALVKEIRTDRDKWGGVVSTSVVRERSYLGKDVARWRQRVEQMRRDAQPAEPDTP